MSALNEVQQPPALASERNVSIDDQVAQIDSWILYDLKSTVLSEVHYENTLYGCFNALLTSIFPLKRRFMVIPQAVVRRALELDDLEDDVSVGSTGALHQSRKMCKSDSAVPNVMSWLNYQFRWSRTVQTLPGFSYCEGPTPTIE